MESHGESHQAFVARAGTRPSAWDGWLSSNVSLHRDNFVDWGGHIQSVSARCSAGGNPYLVLSVPKVTTVTLEHAVRHSGGAHAVPAPGLRAFSHKSLNVCIAVGLLIGADLAQAARAHERVSTRAPLPGEVSAMRKARLRYSIISRIVMMLCAGAAVLAASSVTVSGVAAAAPQPAAMSPSEFVALCGQGHLTQTAAARCAAKIPGAAVVRVGSDYGVSGSTVTPAASASGSGCKNVSNWAFFGFLWFELGGQQCWNGYTAWPNLWNTRCWTLPGSGSFCVAQAAGAYYPAWFTYLWANYSVLEGPTPWCYYPRINMWGNSTTQNTVDAHFGFC